MIDRLNASTAIGKITANTQDFVSDTREPIVGQQRLTHATNPAVVLLVKRGDPISGPLYQATLILSGAIFPVELFPAWLEAIARLTPAYYGVRGMREALLTDNGFSGIADELLVLTVFAVVFLPMAVLAFSRSINAAKRYGVLGSY